MTDDPYSALGLTSLASDEDIRAAYRKLAKELHPDLNPGDRSAEDRFKKVSAAFNLLNDPVKRARFDRGEIDASGQERSGRGFYREYAEGGEGFRHHANGERDFGGFNDIFGDIFGATRDFSGRGQDLRYKLDVEFLEAACGAKKRIIMPEGGTLDLNVPAGVDDGQVLRLKGKGAMGPNDSEAGDALIEITVLEHEFFDRDGNDILVELPIAIDEAITGAKVEVPTIAGRVTFTVPAGSSSGQVLRLRGKGIKNKKTGLTGDQHVRLKIVLPDTIDPDLKSFMEEWRAGHGYDPRKKL